VKRDTELWLLVRKLRSEYRKMTVLCDRWGIELEDAEDKLKAILDDLSVQDSQAETQSAVSSSGEKASLAWDEQSR
jgi:predicted restriction endonuclease